MKTRWSCLVVVSLKGRFPHFPSPRLSLSFHSSWRALSFHSFYLLRHRGAVSLSLSVARVDGLRFWASRSPSRHSITPFFSRYFRLGDPSVPLTAHTRIHLRAHYLVSRRPLLITRSSPPSLTFFGNFPFFFLCLLLLVSLLLHLLHYCP